jgi:hypothetical protein
MARKGKRCIWRERERDRERDRERERETDRERERERNLEELIVELENGGLVGTARGSTSGAVFVIFEEV